MAIIKGLTPIEIERPHGSFNIPIQEVMPNKLLHGDPADTVVFGQGIGEIGQSQEEIIKHLADELGRRVIGYRTRLSSQCTDPAHDMVEVARSTHGRVVDAVVGDNPYSIVGHSIFGLVAGAILGAGQGQVSDLTLISPVTITPEVEVSDEWRRMMRDMTLDERVANFTEFEKHSRRHALRLLGDFAVINLAAETVRGVTNPIKSFKAGKDLIADIAPGWRHAFEGFAVLANVSTMPELERAHSEGTNVRIISGCLDPVVKLSRLRQAVGDSGINLHIITAGPGQGHHNMSTRSGRGQLDLAIHLINEL